MEPLSYIVRMSFAIALTLGFFLFFLNVVDAQEPPRGYGFGCYQGECTDEPIACVDHAPGACEMEEYRRNTYPHSATVGRFHEALALEAGLAPGLSECINAWISCYTPLVELDFNARNGCARVLNYAAERQGLEPTAELWSQCEIFSPDPGVCNVLSSTEFTARPQDIPLFLTIGLEGCEALVAACQQTRDVFIPSHMDACVQGVVNIEKLAPADSPDSLSCSPVQGNELWKPKADSNVGAVILVDDSLQGVPVTVTNQAGEVVTSEIRHVCCPNGGREHRFFSERGDRLAGPIFVRFGDRRCIRVDNPAVRNG